MDKEKIVEKYNCINFSACGNEILFKEKDLEFFVNKGWVDKDGKVNKPKRCKACNLKRKQHD